MSNKKLLTMVIVSLSFSSHIASMEQNQHPRMPIITKHNEKLAAYKAKAIHKDLNQESTTITKKLISYKSDLLTQKQQALDAIKKKHQIDDSAWEDCMLTIKDIETFNKAHQSLPLPNVEHETTVPENLLQLITERLHSCGINPQRINIRGKHNKPYLYSSEPVIPSNIVRAYPGCSEDTNSYAYSLLSEDVKPGTININLDSIALLDMYSKGALCIRMVEDIVQNGGIPSMVITMLEPLLTKQQGAIINSAEFKKFDNLCRKLSVLLPTLNNPTIAACMLQLNFTCSSPEVTNDDYNLLCKIERHWRALAWISEINNLLEIAKKANEQNVTEDQKTKEL